MAMSPRATIFRRTSDSKNSVLVLTGAANVGRRAFRGSEAMVDLLPDVSPRIAAPERQSEASFMA